MLYVVPPLDVRWGPRLTEPLFSCGTVFELNGEVRAVLIEDRDAAIEKVSRERASSEPGSVGAPMAGVVIEVRVKEGQEIKAGDPLLVLSAMKMESVVSSPVSGHVARVVVNPSDSIGQGDREC